MTNSNRKSIKLDVCEIPKMFNIVARMTAIACENAMGSRHLSANSHVWLSSGSLFPLDDGIILSKFYNQNLSQIIRIDSAAHLRALTGLCLS